MSSIGKYITKGLLASQSLFKAEMSVPIAEIETFLRVEKEPKDLVERAYCQYKGNKLYMKNIIKVLFPVLSFFIAPIFAIIAIVKGFFVSSQERVECIGHFDGLTEIIPESLRNKYNIDTRKWSYNFSLSLNDLGYIVQIWYRHPFSFYFFLKCLFNIAKYSDMIRKFNPKVIICHAEFSFTSSILTEYCRSHNIKHIDVMHGEKCFCAKEAFFEYDECYVWDKFYVDLFLKERCAPEQFVVEVPPSLRISVNNINPECYADYKYYLWEDNMERLSIIYEAFNKIRGDNKTVKFRFHPRYCDLEKILSVIPANEIEDPQNVSIIDSLSNTSCAVGFLTTVMTQAYYSKIPLLIDDVAYKEDYANARDYCYILATKHLPRLSSII